MICSIQGTNFILKGLLAQTWNCTRSGFQDKTELKYILEVKAVLFPDGETNSPSESEFPTDSPFLSFWYPRMGRSVI